MSKGVANKKNRESRADANGTIGERVRAMRLRMGLSQSEFAHTARIGLLTIEAIERDEKTPSVALLDTLARVGSVEATSLMDDESRPRLRDRRPTPQTPIVSLDRYPGGRALREAREQANIPARGLAQLANVRYSVIMNYERGSAGIEKNDAIRCGQVLSVDPAVIAPHHFTGDPSEIAPTPPNETLGERFGRLRRERDYNLRHLSDLLGITVANISRIESGRSKEPSIYTLYRAAQVFQCSIAYLICRTDERDGDALPAPSTVTAPTDSILQAIEEQNARLAKHESTLDAILAHQIEMAKTVGTFATLLGDGLEREARVEATQSSDRKKRA